MDEPIPDCVKTGCQCSADCRFECAPQSVYDNYRSAKEDD